MDLLMQIAAVSFGVFAVLATMFGSISHREACIWTSCAACCCLVVGFFAWIQKKDLEREAAKEQPAKQITPKSTPHRISPTPDPTSKPPAVANLETETPDVEIKATPKSKPDRGIKPEDTQRISAAIDATGQQRGTIYLSIYDPTDEEAKKFAASIKRSLMDALFTVTEQEYKRSEKEGECPSLEVLVNPAGQAYFCKWRVILVSAWEKLGFKPQEKYSNNAPHAAAIMVNIGRNA